MLEEIELSRQVVIHPQPILSIQLVLNGPDIAPSSHLKKEEGKNRGGNEEEGLGGPSPREKYKCLRKKSLVEVRKAVKFTDDADDSGRIHCVLKKYIHPLYDTYIVKMWYMYRNMLYEMLLYSSRYDSVSWVCIVTHLEPAALHIHHSCGHGHSNYHVSM